MRCRNFGASAIAIAAASLMSAATANNAAAQPGYNWSGLYAGMHYGSAWSSTEHDVTYQNGLTDHFHFNPPSRIGGFHGGLQTQWGSLVLGLDASLTGGNFQSRKTGRRVSDLVEISDIDWQFMLTPRIGYAFDKFHVYVKGGLASAEIYRGVNDFVSGRNITGGNHRETGWTIGAGFQYAMSTWVSIGLDYSYVRIEPDNRSAWAEYIAAGFPPSTATVGLVEMHTVMARISFKLGRI
jgi:outer membrane immunogenic protein